MLPQSHKSHHQSPVPLPSVPSVPAPIITVPTPYGSKESEGMTDVGIHDGECTVPVSPIPPVSRIPPTIPSVPAPVTTVPTPYGSKESEGMTDIGIRNGGCSIPVSRTLVPIVPVSRPVPYALAPTQPPKATLLLDIACSFDETAFMHGMAAATSAFVDEVDSLEDFAPPEVHAAIMLVVPSTPIAAATVFVPYAPVLTATGYHSAPAPVLNALLQHTFNVLATTSFAVPEGSSLQHVQTRHLWSPIDRGKSATMPFLSPCTPVPVLSPSTAPAEVESPPTVPAKVALPPTVPTEVASPPPVLTEVASPPPVPAEVVPPPPVPAEVELPPTAPAKVVSPPPALAKVAAPPPDPAPPPAVALAPPPTRPPGHVDMHLLDASAVHLDLTIPISDTAFDHVNAPICGFSLSLKTAHSLRMQALLHAPQRAPRGTLFVPPHHISPTLALLTSLTLLVAITILCKAAFHASIALSFKFQKSQPSVHVDLHYFAFLLWVDDARAILLTVPPDPNISDSKSTDSKITNSKITNPRTIMAVPLLFS
jgi:hypothetical protein